MNPGEGVVYAAMLMTQFLSISLEDALTRLMDPHPLGGSKGRTLEPCKQHPSTHFLLF